MIFNFYNLEVIEVILLFKLQYFCTQIKNKNIIVKPIYLFS